MPNDGFKKNTDEKLASMLSTQQEALSEIIDRYQKPLSRYMRRIAMLQDDDIDDLLQNIFVKVYKNINDFDESLKFSSWIYRITHNETIDFMRKKSARPQISNSDEENYIALENFASDSDTEKETRLHFDKKIIHETLSEMNEKYREVLILYYMENKTYNEISDIIQKPKNTVGTLINRAKKNFKEIIGQKYNIEK
jgi:RNA polymerase sigma-70 factor (ECF subfamily)